MSKGKGNWCLYLITESGKQVPHWWDSTRERCRIEARKLRAQSAPRKLRLKIASYEQ